MSTVTDEAPAPPDGSGSPALPTDPLPKRRLGRRAAIAGIVSAVVAAGAAAFVVVPRRGDESDTANDDDLPRAGTALVPVEQRTLTARTQMTGTLGYAAGDDIVTRVDGTITSLPAIGDVVSSGQVLFGVSNAPVILLAGGVPASRDLPAGDSTADRTGADVQQLNAALVALGYASSEDVDATSNTFDWNSKVGVMNLQDALGVDDTGTLTLGSVVFRPDAVRVTATPKALGAPVAAGDAVLGTSSTTPVVTVQVEAARQTEVHQGDTVVVTLPTGASTGAVVSSVGAVATTNTDGDAVIDVQIALDDPSVAGSLDQAPVLVAITTAEVPDALVVPVTALVALAGGGHAVEVADASGRRRLMPVELGLYDDSLGVVQVTDTDLHVGDQVVVPAT